jgi:hypothetical protein
MSYQIDKAGSPGRAPATERRVSPRYAFTAVAEAVESESHARIGGRLSDIGKAAATSK